MSIAIKELGVSQYRHSFQHSTLLHYYGLWLVLEGRCEEARAGPGGLLPCSEDVVAALYCQGTAVVDECVPCDLLGGE